MAISLKKIIAPYFLRRTKAEVTDTKDGVKVDKSEDGVGKWVLFILSMGDKKGCHLNGLHYDFIIFLI